MGGVGADLVGVAQLLGPVQAHINPGIPASRRSRGETEELEAEWPTEGG